MNKYVKINLDRQAKFEETCRKLAIQLFNMPYKYLSNRLSSKVRKIAYNKLTA